MKREFFIERKGTVDRPLGGALYTQSRARWNITKLNGCGLCVCVVFSGKMENITW